MDLTNVRVLSITIAHDGSSVSADFETRERGMRVSVVSRDDLAGFRSRYTNVPEGMPVFRFDMVPEAIAEEFAVRGPMLDHKLPPETVWPLFDDHRKYQGEQWDTLGALTFVSLDVYRRLCDEAGIVVQET